MSQIGLVIQRSLFILGPVARQYYCLFERLCGTGDVSNVKKTFLMHISL